MRPCQGRDGSSILPTRTEIPLHTSVVNTPVSFSLHDRVYGLQLKTLYLIKHIRQGSFGIYHKIWLKTVQIKDKLCITVDNSVGNWYKRHEIWLIIVKRAKFMVL